MLTFQKSSPLPRGEDTSEDGQHGTPGGVRGPEEEARDWQAMRKL